MYVHADPVNGVDPSGLLRMAEQVFVMNELTRLAATMYIGFTGVNSSVGSLLGLSAKQMAAMNEANFGRFIPLVRRDENGCFSTEIPRSGASRLVLNGLIEPPEWYEYATQVSGTDKDFLAITKKGDTSSFDGRTPGTRSLWESKLGYGESFFFNGNPKYTDADKANKLAEWTVQKNKQVLVSGECGYNLTWSFSDRSAYELADDAWGILPPKPQIQFKRYNP